MGADSCGFYMIRYNNFYKGRLGVVFMADDKLINFSYVGMQNDLRAEMECAKKTLYDADRMSHVILNKRNLENGFFKRGVATEDYSYKIGNFFANSLDAVEKKIEWLGVFLDELEGYEDDVIYKFLKRKKDYCTLSKFYLNKGIEGVSEEVDSAKKDFDKKFLLLGEKYINS